MKLKRLLTELVYKYSGSNGSWYYEDYEGNLIIVELFEDVASDRLEMEIYAETGNGKKYSNIRTSIENRGNRGETTLKIFEKEVIPYFKKQTEYDVLCIQPIDEKRDMFFQKMIKMFEKGNYEIVKLKPGLITIRKLK